MSDEALMRPSWDLWFMRMAYVVAERGSCQRKRVGAVIVRDLDRTIVATGYNGAPRGMPDCLTVGCDVRVIDGRESCVRTLHAESNALDRFTPSKQTHSLYTTVIPCRNCALRIVQAGIDRVYYHEHYVSQGTTEVDAIFKRQDPATMREICDRLGMEISPRDMVPRVQMFRLDVPLDHVQGSYGPWA